MFSFLPSCVLLMEPRQCLKAKCKIKALKQHLSYTRKQTLVFQLLYTMTFDHLFSQKYFYILFLHFVCLTCLFLLSSWHWPFDPNSIIDPIILDSNSPWWARVCLSASPLIHPIMSSTMSLHSNPIPDWQRCWTTEPTRTPKAFQTFLLPYFCWIAGVLLPFASFILM